MKQTPPISSTVKSEIADPARIRIGGGCRLPQPPVEAVRVRLGVVARLPR
jgi:hypothetical protein